MYSEAGGKNANYSCITMTNKTSFWGTIRFCTNSSKSSTEVIKLLHKFASGVIDIDLVLVKHLYLVGIFMWSCAQQGFVSVLYFFISFSEVRERNSHRVNVLPEATAEMTRAPRKSRCRTGGSFSKQPTSYFRKLLEHLRLKVDGC